MQAKCFKKNVWLLLVQLKPTAIVLGCLPCFFSLSNPISKQNKIHHRHPQNSSEKDLTSDLQRCSTVATSLSFRREEVKKQPEV